MVERLLVVDVETGGTDADRHSILTLAASAVEVVSGDVQIIDSWQWMIREPWISVTQEALDVNGLKVSDIAERGLDPSEVTGKLGRFIWDKLPGETTLIIAGWNVEFDVRFLHRLYRIAKLPWPWNYRLFDIASVYRFLVMKGHIETQPRLDQALEHFKVEIPAGSRHTALGDVYATVMLLRAMLR